MESYGIRNQRQTNNKIDSHLENLRINGFSIEEAIIEEEFCDKIASLLDQVYQTQEDSFGKENLAKIKELDMVRMPFLYDQTFFKIFMHDLVLELTSKYLGNVFHLHLQNGIINRPQRKHHQTSWHRDLPYQDWVISKPLGFNAFFCITDFNESNGATIVLPHSHQIDYFPNSKFIEDNQLQVNAPKGSIIFFDSMIYHRAGVNLSDNVRYGINNMFVVPILKQQIDLASYCSTMEHLDPKVAKILGVPYQTPTSVDDYRTKRLNKLT
ncbi:MAG TPA: phytanoyl-CoA dioxygenase family protein [Microscillaceae bacterium]|nr:phytanoyl-CoA dioxygenase family protein [Microscillaceae bacterium]